MAKLTSLNDFYGQYMYPCYDVESSTIPINPYIPKEKLKCNHRYSCTKQEYKLIIKTYLKHLMMLLLHGYTFTLPKFMGKIVFEKYKGRFIDWPATKKAGKHVYKKNPQTGNFKSVLKWKKRYKGCKLLYKNHWSFKTLSTFNKLKGEFLREDFNRMNKYNNTK